MLLEIWYIQEKFVTLHSVLWLILKVVKNDAINDDMRLRWRPTKQYQVN